MSLATDAPASDVDPFSDEFFEDPFTASTRRCAKPGPSCG